MKIGEGAWTRCRCVFTNNLMMKWDPCCPYHWMPLARRYDLEGRMTRGDYMGT